MEIQTVILNDYVAEKITIYSENTNLSIEDCINLFLERGYERLCDIAFEELEILINNEKEKRLEGICYEEAN